MRIQRFSKSHLLVLVPPFHFLHNFSMALNVLRRWFALLHLLRNASQAQVVPGADGSEKVAKTTQQASSRVPLLLPTLARERTFQNMIGIHFCYWCIVVLWPGRRHFYVFTVFFRVFFSRGFAFFEGKKKWIWPQEGSVTLRGERGTKRDQKKIFNFFHCTCPSAVNSLHICTCSARALVHGITVPKDRDEVNKRDVCECDG